MWVLFLAAIFAAAAAGQTTITGTINNVDGTPATGTVHITLNRSCQTPGGLKIGGGNPKIVSVIAGAFSTTLYPNDTCIPNGTSYTVRYLVPRPPDGGRAKYWVVPTSGSPVSIASIEFDEAPIPGTYMPISQLTGCSNGQTITHNGTSFVCGSASGIGSLNGLTGSPQTFEKVDDTNVTLGIVSSGTTHTFTMGWTGTLAKARLPGVTAFLDATQTYTAGMRQTFTHDATNAGIRIGSVASNPSSLGSGDFWNNAGVARWYNGTTSLTFEFKENRNVADGYAGLGPDSRIAKVNSNAQTVFADQTITYSSGSVQDMALGHMVMPERPVASLPAANAVPGRIYIAVDSASASSCSVGGGSTRAICRSNGSTYEALGGQALLWGSIGGTLSSQTDLQNALNAKFSLGASNTVSTGDQDFSSAFSFRVPVLAGAAPNVFGRIAYDSTSNTYRGHNGTATKTFAFTDSNIAGNAATATALAADPADCPGGQFVIGINASGVPTCGTPAGGVAEGGYAADVSSAATWTIAGSTHLLGTVDVLVYVSFDNGTEWEEIVPSRIRRHKTNFDVTVNWGVATAGRILIRNAGSNSYAADVSSAATWTISGATHGLGTADLAVYASFDNGTELEGLVPSRIRRHKTSFDVTLNWDVATAGRVLILRSGGGGGASSSTNGTNGQLLTSNGSGGFGTPVTAAAIASSGSASDLSTGTVPAARLPNPGASAHGGVRSKTCTGTDKLSAIGTDGVPVCSADSGTAPVWPVTTVADIDVASMTDSCEARRTTTVAGATVGWPAIVAPPADFPEGAYIDNPPLVTAPNTVKWRVCTKGTVNPPIGTYVIYVIPPTI